MFGRLFMILFLTLPVVYPAQARETIRLTNGEFAPYQSKTLKHYGVLSRIVFEAFAMEGVDVEYGFFPWRRAYDLARSGEWDGTLAWQKTDERAEHFLFSDQLYTSRQVFFYFIENDFHWKSYDDLARYAIGVTLGYTYGEEFDERVREGDLRIQSASTDELNFNKLLMGRIDAFPCNIEVGYYLLRTKFGPTGGDLIAHHPKFLTPGAPLYLMISKEIEKGEHFIEVFNRGLYKLKENGMFDKFVLESRRGEYIR